MKGKGKRGGGGWRGRNRARVRCWQIRGRRVEAHGGSAPPCHVRVSTYSTEGKENEEQARAEKGRGHGPGRPGFVPHFSFVPFFFFFTVLFLQRVTKKEKKKRGVSFTKCFWATNFDQLKWLKALLSLGYFNHSKNYGHCFIGAIVWKAQLHQL